MMIKCETKIYVGTYSQKKNNYIYLRASWVSEHQTLTKWTKTDNNTYPDKTNTKMNSFNNSPTDIKILTIEH